MEIGRNKFVSLTYQLRLDGAQGEMIEETSAESPLEFVFGTGRMLEMFEEKLDSMKAGDKFDFDLKAEDAYGEVNKEAIVDLPKNIFEVDGSVDEEMLTVGNTVPMQDASGNRLNGIILEVSDDAVKMDFNHPLAGDNLHFSGSILSVREATEDELVAVTQSCSGHGDGCDSGCGDSCGCH
jgi:FKBP-type peptidyl-prolyl cis-trans isomerase SlyD